MIVGFRRGRCVYTRDITIETKHSSRILVLPLRQIVAEAMDIRSPFEGMIPAGLGPVIGDVQIRFPSDPRQACRIPNQAVVGIVARQDNTGQSARIQITKVRSLDVDADLVLNCLTAIGIVRHVPIMVNASADLRDQGW